LEPVYKTLPGWKTDLTRLDSEENFPAELIDYISYLEKELACPITIVSVGPDRSQTIVRKGVPQKA
jgi:adenylosuccinate synthase